MKKAEFPGPSGVTAGITLGCALRGGLGVHQIAMQEETLCVHILAPRVPRTGQSEEQKEKNRGVKDYGPPLPFTTVADADELPTTGQPSSRRIMISS